MVNYTPQLPDIFPQGDIKVSKEKHLYKTYEGDSFDPVLEEKEYTIDKAPVKKIIEITGVSSGESKTFVQGTDYVLSSDNERIVWQDDPADRPDAGSLFYITYRCQSIISRYLESSGEELHDIDGDIEEVISSKFVDSATGDNLDEIGKIFGALGQRRGRTDTQYRIYLKSIVQSFISRGTVNGIKVAISAATEVPVKDISIIEDFTKNEYEVVVVPNNPVNGVIIEEIAEIADPSGINQVLTRFTPSPDITGINETIDITEGQQIPDNIGIADTVETVRANRLETVGTADTVLLNPNTFSSSDVAYSNDSIAINPNTFSSSDVAYADDSGTFNRAEASDSLFSDDAFAIDPNKTVTSESLFSDDAAAFDRSSTDDSVSSDDQVADVDSLNKNEHKWEETTDPDVTTEWGFFEWTEPYTEWNTNDWNTLKWV